LPQELASLLPPGNRPEIQPRTRDANPVAPRSGSGSDTFAQTLDRQQPAPGQRDENIKAGQNEPPAENAIASEDTPDITDNVDFTIAKTAEVFDESLNPDPGVAANPALLITPATLEFKAPDLALALNQSNGLKGAAAIPLLNETQLQTSPKLVPVAPATDGFAKELAILNTAAGSKLAFDEARAQSANLFSDEKPGNNSGGLLQKALAETSAFQNTGQKGAPNAAQNPAAAPNTGFTPGATIGSGAAEIPSSAGELSITPQNAHGISTKFGTAIQTNQSAQTPVNLLAVQIARHVDLGINRFQIRMDPPELGRIEVKLEFGRDGRMSANLTVERAETLDLLQRDARALERALANSGLNTDKNSLNFSLKDQSANEYADFKRDGENSPDGRQGLNEDDTNSGASDNIAAYRSIISQTAVDIRI